MRWITAAATAARMAMVAAVAATPAGAVVKLQLEDGQPALLVGQAGVIDAGSMTLAGQTIRLLGLEALAAEQFCTLNGQRYLCGQWAAFALIGHLEGREVSCMPEVQAVDGSVFARCAVDGADIGAWLVRQGWALAAGNGLYAAEQAAARREGLGVWRGQIEPLASAPDRRP